MGLRPHATNMSMAICANPKRHMCRRSTRARKILICNWRQKRVPDGGVRHCRFPAYLSDCANEVSLPTIYGYGQLAMLYALINNTVPNFYLHRRVLCAYTNRSSFCTRLADPGTVQLIKSGVTLVTAVTSMIFLSARIARLQWLAIGLQICGREYARSLSETISNLWSLVLPSS